jgi:high-affinity iron transporter
MRIVLIFVTVCSGAAAAAPAPAPAPASAATVAPDRDAHRVIGVLEYISTDYALAVHDGKVLSRPEYEEQLNLVLTARALFQGLRDPRAQTLRPEVLPGLTELEQAVRAVKAPAEVSALCHRIRIALVREFGLRLAPRHAPSLPRAQELFAQACADCHGSNGRADGPRSKELQPPPASFHSPERIEALTPYRVFNTITFGVPNTAMASFEDALSSDDRWSLAFYVLSLRHQGKPSTAAPKLPLSELATASDGALRTRLRARGVPAAEVESAVAALRTQIPFQPSDYERGLARARDLLDECVAAFLRGDRVQATQHATDAYFEGFEPIEVALRLRDAALVRSVEGAFVAVRQAVRAGDAGMVRSTIAKLRGRLDDTERELLSKPGDTAVAFVGGFLILFREGIEAALLIAALLGILARMKQPRATRWVHYGWLAAIAAGAGTYAAAQGLVRIGAEQREILEGALSLFAAAILFYVSYWLIAKSDVQRWMGFLKSKLQSSVGSRRGLWAIAGIAFVAVYREVFETVLFYQAMLLDARGHEAAIAGGAVVAAIALVAAVYAIFRLGRRLPLTPFFLVSSVLLCLLAAVLGGKGVHSLQAAGVLPWMPAPFPHVDWLGLYPDGLSVIVQGAITAALVGAAIYELSRRRRASRAQVKNGVSGSAR